MADGFEITVNASRIKIKLEKMPAEVRDALTAAVFIDAGMLANLAQGRTPVRTGKLARSIKPRISVREKSVTGRVSTRDERAGLLEWGGKTPAHEILPDKAKALTLPNGKFAARVQHPGGKYRALKMIHGALDEMKAQIVSDLENAVAKAAERIDQM